jgi:hypothetical protein
LLLTDQSTLSAFPGWGTGVGAAGQYDLGVSHRLFDGSCCPEPDWQRDAENSRWPRPRYGSIWPAGARVPSGKITTET